MYKVLIVDDEPLARIGLQKTINWSQYGFEIVGDAEDTDSAIQLYNEFKPDVIITDIYMEPVDGLNLIETLKNINKDLEFIVISGFNDFNYAQTAMKFGVSCYLLKPIENDDLVSSLISLKEKLDKRYRINRIVSEYNEKQSEAFLFKLLASNDSIEEKNRFISKEGNFFPKTKRYVVVSMLFNDFSKAEDSPNELTAFLQIISKRILSENKQLSLSTCLKSNNVVLVIFENEKNILTWEESLKAISKEFTSSCGKQLTIGVSSISSGIEELSKAYMQSRVMFKEVSNSIENTIMSYTPIANTSTKNSPDFSSEQAVALLEAIMLNKLELANEIINSYFEQAKNFHPLALDDVKYTIINVAIYIISRYITTPEMIEMVFNRPVHPAKEIYNMASVEEIHLWISEFIKKLMDNHLPNNYSEYSLLIQNAIKYIMANYAGNCDINQVANQLYVSPGHLMRKFRQETGKTFLEYLTEYRISIAIVLLQSGSYKTYEVSTMVGYTTTKYFSKVFKRITGKNPKDFMN